MASLGTYKKEWLSHLKHIPHEAKRNRVSLYTIALEGWRRGLRVTFYNDINEENELKLYYSMSNGKRMHHFEESNGDKNSNEAVRICNDKALTSGFLQKANIPIPRGKNFSPYTPIKEIVSYAKQLTFPLVVKPTDESSGRGVTTNIQTETQLIAALETVRNQFKHKHLIVQEHITGKEIRIYVLNGEVLAAAHRRPANVIGDGRSTIAQLIEEKNELRKLTPHLYYRPILVNKQLHEMISKKGYTLDSVLNKGERLYLRTVSNISAGGDPVDVTNTLSERQREIAVEAVKAVPGLTHCGVDMIVDEENESGVILELNTKPGIGSHLFPIEGKAVDIPRRLIDYYFPETQQVKREMQNELYFNLQGVFDTVSNGYLSELELKSPPTETLCIRQLIIETDLDIELFYEKIKPLISRYHINGSMGILSDKRLRLVLSHETETNVKDVIRYIQNRTGYLAIHNVKVEESHVSPYIGFRLDNGLNRLSLWELEREFHENEKKHRILERELARLKKRIQLIQSSMSWKITKPIRMLKRNRRKESNG